jgi:hypothetical protein
LNNPIEHYREMEIIFGNNLATGAYAKRAHEPLATEITETHNAPHETEDDAATNEEASPPIGANEMPYSVSTHSTATSSRVKSPPPKKAKVVPIEDPNVTIVSVTSESLGNLATTI